MHTRFVRGAVLTALFTGLAAFAASSPPPVAAVDMHAAVKPLGAGHESAAQERKGRYKKDGDKCVWDGNDTGPDQCTPQTRGRFKKGANDTCVWDANDRGADQCTPKTGRWKEEGGRCVWEPKDSGPNQCDPRRPR